MLPNLYEWARRYRYIDGHPFSLARHKPLEQIYKDEHPNKVIQKPAQVGVSEYAISFVCHLLDIGAQYHQTDKKGLNVGYLFPTQTALTDFVKERFGELREESPKLESLFTDYDDVGFKQAGQSYLYLRGAWTTKGLKSFPADALVYDEFDEMLPKAAALAEKRLRASVLKFSLKISTPTLPGRGINAEYNQSDQHVWEVHCEACDAWNELDYFRDIRAGEENWDVLKHEPAEKLRRATLWVACPNCKKEVDRCGDGRWTARNPESSIRGYHIPALAFPIVDLNSIAVNLTSDDPEVVKEAYRSDLGLPFEIEGSQVTDTMLQQLSHSLENGKLPVMDWYNTTMGVDVGSKYHYRISSAGTDGNRYVRKIGKVSTWAELSNLIDEYKVRRCVIDALPELHGCEEWQAKHPGIVIRAFYPNSTNLKGQLFQPESEDIEDIVNINRTMAMDTVYTDISACRIIVPAEYINTPEIVAQLKAPVKILEKNKDGQEIAHWVHTSPDHYFHAFVYDVIASRTLIIPNAGLGIFVQGTTKGW